MAEKLEKIVILDKDILPIFIMKGKNPTRPISFHGTGFVIASELFVTCWHCVSTPLPEDCRYAVAIKTGEKEYKAIYLSNIQQDANGTDLATANLPHIPTIPLFLATREVPMGTNVLTFGYPLTDEEKISDESICFQLNGRYTEGYIMRDFYYKHARYGRVASYELNFQVPEGLSGAPLIKLGSREVIGIIYGSHDVAAVDQFASIDSVTGKREPEIQKLIQFGLAHYTNTLHNLCGIATKGLSLIEYMTKLKSVSV